MEIKNITLNKEKYIYGIDKKIILTFEVDKNISDEKINTIKVNYGFNIICRKYKYNIYVKKYDVKEIITLNNKKICRFNLPISVFNLLRKKIGINNYIHINTGIICKTIKLNPTIKYDVLECNKHGIKNLSDYMKDDTSNDVEEDYDSIFHKEKTGENISIKNRFYGIFSGFIYRDYYDNISLDKEVYNKLRKKSFLFKILSDLLNSKLVQFTYKYIFLFLII
ncbi:MAG: hypothetical protein GY828_07655, partial [Candidatus Gracilibacteria bacterium]|nr:hypothetical protein [Candidatus Gracilibacteria bacterium]